MKYLFLACLLSLSMHTFSQVGIGTTSPHSSSILEIQSTTQGFLPPRLTEAEMNAISSPSEGLFIYNLDDSCFKYYKGSSWSNCLGETASNSLDCSSMQTFGDYVITQPLGSSHKITIDVLVNVIEPYSITTSVVNGYSFSAAGVFSSIGVNTITLVGSGTPLAVQSDNFTVNFKSSSCSSNIAVNAVASILANCLEYFNDGNITDGIYTIDPDGSAGADVPYDCYCDMTNNGGGWTLIFAHDTVGGFWANDAQADSFNVANPNITTTKYSILSRIDAIKSSADYEFRLHYPALGLTNHWTQTFDPRSGGSSTSPVLGYNGINIGMTQNGWGGLERSGGNTFLDGTVNHVDWWYSIGSVGSFGVGMPASNVSTNKVLLFVR